MDLQLTGKCALVTGSSSGIGTGIARMLAEEGCRVVVHGRNRERADRVAAEIGAVAVAIGDLATKEGADVVADAALAALGTVDILINNAGGSDGDTGSMHWLEVDEESWIDTYRTNMIAPVRLIRKLVPGMKARQFGRIVQIASAVGIQPLTLGPDYAGAKAALLNVTVSLASELGGTGITVNSITPGIVLTPAVAKWAGDIASEMGWGDIKPDEIEQRLARELLKLPAARIGRVEDIALAVAMLASPRSGYITGSNIRVDGGQIHVVS